MVVLFLWKQFRIHNRLNEMFEQKGYLLGIKDHSPIYCWDNVHCIPKNHANELAGMMTLSGALSGMSSNSAIDLGTNVINRVIIEDYSMIERLQ